MNNETIKQLKDMSLNQIREKYGVNCSFINLENAQLNLAPKHKGLVEQIRDLQTLRNDLRYVAEWLSILSEFEITSKQHALIANSLWFSVIITYGKCFASADKKTRLEEKDYFKGESDQLKLVHKDMIDTRNSYIAHNLDYGLSKTEIFLSLEDSNKKQLLGVDGISYSQRGASPEDVKAYESVVIMVHNKIDNLLKSKEEYLHNELKPMRTVDEWCRFITD
ncbi:MAG: hypothetical protein PHE96_12750 [Methylococcales bacterium]|nr:hypothetical protein [Methylococcales bacterium]